ncbi:UDP-N-acetylmuramate dehydrogenase [Belliella kenyensis]|uniref:UDP-N-acetylenolpyruvoylglucosamine reductase n=1 Tax=Belliella kenyensis TaxID=1472724 RepID=A0ABV8ELA2_9BACT|nr:UDP-N-acetylmuramate dehydrogenase [Belliella kenyensis]MCH7400498.1 UDP-N-acetylmuramate dehydrogenase [Belliella kenyensis]MDN3604486.1 UDP-N-acetylmuramate dehydrogenase [Belliella kenyensis]
MNIQENISLLPYNTFGIDKKAKFFSIASSEDDVIAAIKAASSKNLPLIVLGGGSNVLLTQDIDAWVLKIDIKGVQATQIDEEKIEVAVGAGEVWHDFVIHCIDQGWAGVENLSLIPGTVGASPMQNIGAYGIEIKDVFEKLEAINRTTLELETFDWNECKFGYRESVFKNELKDKYIITKVFFVLNKNPNFNVSYGAIQETLDQMGESPLSIRKISDAVIYIRQQKLPDPKKLGNAGSFFKNPTISTDQFVELKSKFSNLPGYPVEDGVKVPAAWLIEQDGWKGKTFGNIGVHKNQPLVLVNYGNGEGKEIAKLSKSIQESVFQKFGIMLHPEVNFL